MKSFLFNAILMVAGAHMALAAPADAVEKRGSKTSNYIAQHSPIFHNMKEATGVVSSYNYGPYDTSDTLSKKELSGYPKVWKTPPTDSDEVKAAIDRIDWSLVPDAPVRTKGHKKNKGDPYCWWSDTNCVKPKINIPEDFHSCDNQNDWGLSFDDGPFNLYSGKDAKTENDFAEPALYNYLAKQNNQKATLFYIGSNVATYPAAAKRAFNDGHYICVHTWSHPAMTTISNEEAVAELYWGLKAIKEATGITPKCWRPPQGDVDDRIRSIAWQMGMTTVLWDRDTEDWDMPAPGGGNLSPETVDGYFQDWIDEQKKENGDKKTTTTKSHKTTTTTKTHDKTTSSTTKAHDKTTTTTTTKAHKTTSTKMDKKAKKAAKKASKASKKAAKKASKASKKAAKKASKASKKAAKKNKHKKDKRSSDDDASEGHIVLQHELNHATVEMTEKWLPTLQKVFNVIPAMACNGVTQPYWETDYVYPLDNQPARS